MCVTWLKLRFFILSFQTLFCGLVRNFPKKKKRKKDKGRGKKRKEMK
jgi:hypothetical protein